jgi:type I restriction-modification system DNA methylase subunit
MTNKQTAQDKIESLVTRFEEQFQSYKHSDYNETLTRRDFIDPFFKALGWDIDNEAGYAEAYREVIHEDRVKVSGATKAPDYSFRLVGGKRLFFVEAKKPSVSVKEDIQPAYQVRRYGWSAKLPISIITDFEEFAVYDCTKKPKPNDKPAVARIKYLSFRDYIKEFDFIWDTFSKEQVLKGSFDKFLLSDTNKKGTATVDKDFLESLDRWRTYLAVNISWKNRTLDEDEINFVVQQTIDRIIFLRIAEDRSVEPYGNLKNAVKQGNLYQNLFDLFQRADEKYNSGLFDIKKDKISRNVVIENKIIRTIINELYYPECPYEFSVLSVEILGSAYEQFLGKVIRITPAHHAKIEEKPEVRKAGGVYYTPQYIVDYIVKNTVGKLIEGKTPKEISKIKILDPACGSGSFLIGAYQYLLDYHKDYYSDKGKPSKGKKGNPLTPDGHLTTAEKKKILLNNIFGVDLDSNAVEVTKLSLLIKCLEGETEASIQQQLNIWNERVLPTLDNNIKDGNSLIDIDFYSDQLDYGFEKKIKPFNWNKSFSEIFQNGGFNIVIGNPPYGFHQIHGPSEKVYFKNKYASSQGSFENYFLFYEKSLKLLSKDGLHSFIAPVTWLTIPSAKSLRKFILDNFAIIEITWLPDKVFEAAQVNTLISIIKNTKSTSTQINIYDSLGFVKPPQINNSINQNDFKEADYYIGIFEDDLDKTILSKIQKLSKPLKNFCRPCSGYNPYEVGKGIAPDGKPHTKETVKSKPYHSDKKLGAEWKPEIIGRDLSRYYVDVTRSRWIKYGKWLAAPRDSNNFLGERILVQEITGGKNRRIIAAYYDGELYHSRDVIPIKFDTTTTNPLYILAIINSDLITWYHHKRNPKAQKGLFPKVLVSDLEKLPIKEIETQDKNVITIQNKIIELAEQLLSLHKDQKSMKLISKIEQLQNKIDYCENQINMLIYQLYELTPEEIGIIQHSG